MKLAITAALLAPVLLSSLAAAQSPLFFFSGEDAGDRLGYSTAGVGDVDGDLVPDWVIGAPTDDPNGTMSGSVRVVSGISGAVIHEFTGNSALDMFGHSVSGGDVDGDGLADVIVGAHGNDQRGTDSGTVYVYSGLDGALLFAFHGPQAGDNLGLSVAFVPDVNGDGRGEILAGAKGSDLGGQNAGMARLYSGANGSILQTFLGESDYDLFGCAVAGVGDANGDGFGDVLIGAPWNDHAGIGAGSAYLYSGANGVLLHVRRGASAGDGFGYAVADAGDVNGDGRSDLLIGAPAADQGGQNAGRAYVYSGSTGVSLYTFTGDDPGDNFGSAVAGDLDADGDGLSDLFIGAFAADPGGASSGLARIYAGADGSEIATFEGAAAGDRLGGALAGGGDADGDGIDELLIGAWGEDSGPGPLTGGLHVMTFSATDPPTWTYCAAGTNSTAQGAFMGHEGTTSIAAEDLVLTCSGVVPLAPGIFFYGSQAVQVPFGDGFRCVGGSIFRLHAVWADDLGNASKAVDYQNPPNAGGLITVGSVWHFQFWYRDPGSTESGFNLSDGLGATFVP